MPLPNVTRTPTYCLKTRSQGYSVPGRKPTPLLEVYYLISLSPNFHRAAAFFRQARLLLKCTFKISFSQKKIKMKIKIKTHSHMPVISPFPFRLLSQVAVHTGHVCYSFSGTSALCIVLFLFKIATLTAWQALS